MQRLIKRRLIFFAGCVVAALAPFVAPFIVPAHSTSGNRATEMQFSGWMTHFEGRPLVRLPLSKREERFGSDFPGHIARFTDGEREVIVRWLTQPTRKLHPAADCFQGVGYRVRPLPLRIGKDGTRWAGFAASKGDSELAVYERIYDERGNTWTDASSWYWAATTGSGGETHAPWYAITVAERLD